MLTIYGWLGSLSVCLVDALPKNGGQPSEFQRVFVGFVVDILYNYYVL